MAVFISDSGSIFKRKIDLRVDLHISEMTVMLLVASLLFM